MITKTRTFLIPSPSGSETHIPALFYDCQEKWLIVLHDVAGRRPELPELWIEALSALDEEPDTVEESVWNATTAQVEGLLKRVGIEEWFFTKPASSPMSDHVGVQRGEEEIELAEAKSGTWSNHPYHSQWDDHYSYVLERWIGPEARAINIQQSHRRGAEESQTRERWFVHQPIERWIEQNKPDLTGWRCVERM